MNEDRLKEAAEKDAELDFGEKVWFTVFSICLIGVIAGFIICAIVGVIK